MKKIILMLLTGLLTITVLVACGNDEEKSTTNENENTDVTDDKDVQNDDNVDENEDKGMDENNEEDSTDENSSDSSNGFFEVTEEPQTDLRLGDTGFVQTSIGDYELTINSAEIVGTELDGENALLDEIILLGMTFKNVGDEPINAEDVMFNLGLVTDLEGSDNTNAAASFDSIEYFEGEIAPGEEREAQFIADTRTAEEYYFRTSPGTVAAGTQNEVIWTITDEEARNE